MTLEQLTFPTATIICSNSCIHLKPPKPMEDMLKSMMDLKSYRLHNRSRRFALTSAKRTSRCQHQMKTQTRNHEFNGMDPIGIFNFMEQLRRVCISDEIHASIILLTFFRSSLLHNKLQRTPTTTNSNLSSESRPITGSKNVLRTVQVPPDTVST